MLLRYDFEMSHHPAGVVLENMAVVHPLAGPVLRYPDDPYAPIGRNVDGVLPGEKSGCLAIYLQHLEEEAVKVKRVIHRRHVDDVPDLKLTNPNRIGPVMQLVVDREVY